MIALTASGAGRLSRDGLDERRIHVVPSGVEPGLFAGGTGPDPFAGVGRPRVAYVGRLAPQKSVSTLVEAFGRLDRSDAHLLVVGDGPERALVASALRRSPAAARSHLVGFVPHDDVPALLRHVDLLVLSSRYEELGSVLLEAMQAGPPIVASAVGGIPDVVVDGDNGLLVPPR